MTIEKSIERLFHLSTRYLPVRLQDKRFAGKFSGMGKMATGTTFLVDLMRINDLRHAHIRGEEKEGD